MTSVDLTYWIPMILSIVSFALILFGGKKLVLSKNRYFRFAPLLAVISLIIGVFYITNYNENQLQADKIKLLEIEIENKKQRLLEIEDSIFISTLSKKQKLEDLQKADKELTDLLYNIKKRERITGEDAALKIDIKNKIEFINKEIGYIKSYNEIIEDPPYLSKGLTTAAENSSDFLFICPTNKEPEYIDLKIRFKDEKLISEIASIYIVVTEVRDGKNWLEFQQAYKPKKGVNAFKIKNFLKIKNTSLEIGYIRKSETKKAYPDFVKISCNY
ncbi:MAG: hypothetical protein Q7W45_10590 [Bacteroidota bacterium]|nr:hypothetical protein [Bacteroidota bacterium]MDP3146097.1 hypothetical protein [Bacteroidota bacterium]